MEHFSKITRYDHQLSLDDPIKAEFYSYQGTKISKPLPDMHYALHLGILLKGKHIISYQDYSGTIEEGQVWYTGTWEPHSGIRLGIPVELILFTFLPEQIGKIGLSANINWLLPFFLPPSERIYPADVELRRKLCFNATEVKNLLQENQTDITNGLIWLKFHEILLCLVQRQLLKSTNYNKKADFLIRILPAIELIQKNNHRPISLLEAATTCHLAKSRFSEIFKNTMGITFGKFAIRARISGAITDLREKKLTIKEIAEKWGFYDVSHLYKVLQQNINKNPLEL